MKAALVITLVIATGLVWTAAILYQPPRVLPNAGTPIAESEKPGYVEIDYKDNEVELMLWGNWQKEVFGEKIGKVKHFECRSGNERSTNKGKLTNDNTRRIEFRIPVDEEQPIKLAVFFKNGVSEKLDYSKKLFVEKTGGF